MWKRYKKQIGIAAAVCLLGGLVFAYGMSLDLESGAFIRTVAVIMVAVGVIALAVIGAAAFRISRIMRKPFAQWTSEDGTQVALYQRAVLADGILNDFSAPGVNIMSRTYESSLLIIEYSFSTRGGVQTERITLAVPANQDEAVKRYMAEAVDNK